MASLKSLLGKEILFFDGGTGSVLQQQGLKPGELPETWNVRFSEKIINLHYEYFCAGANIVKTNTFGAYESKFSDDELSSIIKGAVNNANEARNRFTKENPNQNCFIVFDIGPCGKLLKPMGDLDFEDAVNLFKKTIRLGLQENVDGILIETMNDSYETKACVLAAKEVRSECKKDDLPILVTNVYDEQCHLLTGANPETMVVMLEGLGVDAIGLNCSLGPKQMKNVVPRLVATASVPVIVNPNAGLPRVVDGKTVYDVNATEFASYMKEIVEIGACVVGGCCGTTPEYIKAVTTLLKNQKLVPVEVKNKTVVTSYSQAVEIGAKNVPVLIGERINPTGKKKFKQALRDKDIPYIIHQGLEQENANAKILDVNATEFASYMKEIVEIGAAVVGGCCGTTSEYIKAVTTLLKNQKLVPVEVKNKTVVTSYSQAVEIGGNNVPVLIGERINPTGKKKFKQALRDKDIPYIIHQGLEQENANAKILDVNVGLPEIDEKEMMVQVMTELQGVTSLPLQIDTASPDVLEAALRRYNGKALVNSVNGKTEVMEAVFPIVKKYGGVVVALTLDETGIPETSEGRIKIAEKIIATAQKYGIAKKDIVVDALTMAVSSDINAAKATLETVKYMTQKGINTILGVSNISFGLPNREIVTSTFFALALENGLSSAIMNPLSMEMKKVFYSFCLLKGFDKDCLDYINFSENYDKSKE
ncbi:MAG: homocysteine S-methyltransferase family protein, partial [Treponema sp.]|nr:homocysteine S-methyltransferase family protein [Treponema sp.]